MSTMSSVARGESYEVKIRRLLRKHGLENRQGGQGPKENRTECDIHLTNHPVAIEVQFADVTKRKNENFSIGKDKLAKINPKDREAFLLFGNENSGRYMIVTHEILQREADEVTRGDAKYVGLQDRGSWYLVYPEYLTEICVCEADTLEDLIKRFSQLERFRMECQHENLDKGDEFSPDRCRDCFAPVYPDTPRDVQDCAFSEGSCKAADCPKHGWTR